MAYKNIVFADRVVGISMSNGVVRIDLAINAGTTKGKDDQPAQRLEITHQLVMPLEGFVAAQDFQQRLLNEIAAQQKRAVAATEGKKGA